LQGVKITPATVWPLECSRARRGRGDHVRAEAAGGVDALPGRPRQLETLYGAVDDGAVKPALPRFVRKELEGYLDCGLLCRGFARLRCDGCAETRLVAKRLWREAL
jgi:hypothetical protein